MPLPNQLEQPFELDRASEIGSGSYGTVIPARCLLSVSFRVQVFLGTLKKDGTLLAIKTGLSEDVVSLAAFLSRETQRNV